MNYYDRVLESDGTWINKGKNCKLPSDQLMKDPIKLAELSGPVIYSYIKPDPKVDCVPVQRKLDTYNY